MCGARCLSAFGVIATLAISPATAQFAAGAADQAYKRPEEAARRLPPLPAACVDAAGENACEPSFWTRKAPDLPDLLWRPGCHDAAGAAICVPTFIISSTPTPNRVA